MRRTLAVTARRSSGGAPRAPRQAGGALERFVEFEVAGHRLAVSVTFLREVVEPGAWPAGEEGECFAILHQGTQIAALNLRVAFGWPAVAAAQRMRVLVGEAGGHRFGLAVDAVREIVEVGIETVLPIPAGVSHLPAACFRGIWARANRVVLALDAGGLTALGCWDRCGETATARSSGPARETP